MNDVDLAVPPHYSLEHNCALESCLARFFRIFRLDTKENCRRRYASADAVWTPIAESAVVSITFTWAFPVANTAAITITDAAAVTDT